MQSDLVKDKVAIITGGARGIGKATAETLAAQGAIVIIWDLLAAGQETVNHIVQKGGRAFFTNINITDFSAVQEAANQVVAEHQRIDILINNAGITRDKTLAKMELSEWQSVIDVNLNAIFNCTKAVVPHMLTAKYGRIVCTSSVVGVHGAFGQGNYAATKAGIIGLVRTWSKELAKHNITVNAIAPGYIYTEMTEEIPDEVKFKIMAQIPAQRMGTTQDIADCFLFLVGPYSSYINGQVIGVNGALASS
jgi:3-oxoacyl-[acyl-carrier protein] reductase